MAPEPGRGGENAVQQWEVAGFDGVERGSVLLEEFAGLGPGRCVDPAASTARRLWSASRRANTASLPASSISSSSASS
jgi:hypothetical protein